MWVGASRERLSKANMPSHDEVRRFAWRLSELIGYKVLGEVRASRVVLLSSIEKPIRHGKGCPEGPEDPEPPGRGEYDVEDPELTY